MMIPCTTPPLLIVVVVVAVAYVCVPNTPSGWCARGVCYLLTYTSTI